MKFSRTLKFMSEVLLGVCTVLSCHAQQADASTAEAYTTPVEQAIKPTFPLREISGCEVPGETVNLVNAAIEIGQVIRIHNPQNSAAKWNTSLYFSPVLGCDIYQGDLDNNGTDDLVIVTYGGDSSGGYDTRLTILLMDRDGMPFPWRTQGYFRAEKSGIQEIAQGKDHRAMILDSIAVGQAALGGVSYGYRLFHPVDGRVREEHGSYAGVSWPLLPKGNPNNKELQNKIASSQKNTYLESGNSVESAIAAKDTLKVIRLQHDGVLLSGAGRIALPEIAVFDQPDGNRTILFEPGDAELAPYFKQSNSIRLMGTTDFVEDGGPLLLWAGTHQK